MKIQMALTSLSMWRHTKQSPIRLTTSQSPGQEKPGKGSVGQLAIPEVLECGKEEAHFWPPHVLLCEQKLVKCD